MQVAGAGSAHSAPSIFVRSVNPEGEADIAVEGPNNTLMYYFSRPTGWNPVQLAPAGSTYSMPSIFVRTAYPASEADVVAEGANHTLQYYWGSPNGTGGHIQVAPAGSAYSG